LRVIDDVIRYLGIHEFRARDATYPGAFCSKMLCKLNCG